MTEIIVRYTGPFDQSPIFKVGAGGDDSQVAIRDDLGNINVIYTGKKFSLEEYEKRGGVEEENFYLHGPKR